jgi:hypothetical protein
LTSGLAINLNSLAVLRIRDVYSDPIFSIPDPDPHQRIRVFFTQKLKSKIQNVHPGFRILDLDFVSSRIPDPSVKKSPDPGSATLSVGRDLDNIFYVSYLFGPKNGGSTNGCWVCNVPVWPNQWWFDQWLLGVLCPI